MLRPSIKVCQLSLFDEDQKRDWKSQKREFSLSLASGLGYEEIDDGALIVLGPGGPTAAMPTGDRRLTVSPSAAGSI
jgi:hypothetical protein